MACAPLVGAHLNDNERGHMLLEWSYSFTVPTNLAVGVICLLVSALIWWRYFQASGKGSRSGWLRYLGFVTLWWAGMFVIAAFTIG